MEECEICGSFEEVKDAVFEAKPTQVCKGCSQMSGVIILEKPSTEKIKDVERAFSVRERLEEAAKVKEMRMQRIADAEQKDEKTAFPESISYKLRKEREASGLSKEKLSDEVGLNMEEIEKIEGGENPSEKALKRYEQFFKKKFEILEGTEQKESVEINKEKGSLKELIGRARTFFTRGKVEEEKEEQEEPEIKKTEENKDELQIY